MVVSFAAALLVPLQIWWISRYRPLGAFDTDEAGYMATALRFERNLEDGGLGALIDRVTETSSAPLVPLLSVPFIQFGSRSVLAVMAIQPMLHAIAALAVAGVSRTIGSARQSVVAGALVLCLPAGLIAGRSYHLALAASAACALAVWALVASARCQRRVQVLLFGLAVGAMLLTRSMMVVFLPGLGLAALLLAGRRGPALRNLAMAFFLALVVALPWWVSAWGPSGNYLLRYGYGDRAASYAAGPTVLRPLQRIEDLSIDLQVLWSGAAVIVVVLAGWALLGRFRDGGLRIGDWIRRERETAAVAITAGLAWLVLLTTANAGKWFQLPVVLLAVPLALRSAELLTTVTRRVVAAVVLAGAIVHLVVIGNVTWVRDQSEDPFGKFEKVVLADPRLATSSRHETASAWWAAHQQLLGAVEHAADPAQTPQLTVVGSSPLANLNSVLLAQELTGIASGPVDGVDSTAPNRSDWLSPVVDGRPRILLVLRSTADPFPADVEFERFALEATGGGWTQAGAVTLPDGGTALVMVHPDSAS